MRKRWSCRKRILSPLHRWLESQTQARDHQLSQLPRTRSPKKVSRRAPRNTKKLWAMDKNLTTRAKSTLFRKSPPKFQARRSNLRDLGRPVRRKKPMRSSRHRRLLCRTKTSQLPKFSPMTFSAKMRSLRSKWSQGGNHQPIGPVPKRGIRRHRDMMVKTQQIPSSNLTN